MKYFSFHRIQNKTECKRVYVLCIYFRYTVIWYNFATGISSSLLLRPSSHPTQTEMNETQTQNERRKKHSKLNQPNPTQTHKMKQKSQPRRSDIQFRQSFRVYHIIFFLRLTLHQTLLYEFNLNSFFVQCSKFKRKTHSATANITSFTLPATQPNKHPIHPSIRPFHCRCFMVKGPVQLKFTNCSIHSRAFARLGK